MSQHDWNANYVGGVMPWDTGAPDENLIEVARHLAPSTLRS